MPTTRRPLQRDGVVGRFRLLLAGLLLGLASACTLLPGSQPEPSEPALTPAQEKAKAALPDPVRRITAQTPVVRAYRKTGARHLYARYASRIYKGKLPPLVYAVVTVETHLDANGAVEAVSFMRTPSHAPEVSLAIMELIQQSGPFPTPGRLGAHTYVDTWLWDKSGQFQIDSLTEGQRSR